MNEFWPLALALTLVCAFFIGLGPLRERRLLPFVGVFLLVAVVASALYRTNSNFDPAMLSQTVDQPSLSDLLRAVDEKPNDAGSWQQLGNAYMQLQRFDDASAAYSRVYELVGDGNPSVMISYAEALAYSDPEQIGGTAGDLFLRSLTLAPDDPRALWYSGLVMLARDQPVQAKQYWQHMLALNPPPKIRSILEQQIAQIDSPALIQAMVEVTPELAEVNFEQASVFIVATGESTGGPPIAVRKYGGVTFPLQVSLGDSHSMAGRLLSQQSEVTLRARVSFSGDAKPEDGDLFGELRLQLPAQEAVTVTINQRVGAN